MNVAIIGASGYTGLELIKILINHPKFNITYIANSTGNENVQDLHPCLAGVIDVEVSKADASEVAKVADLAFLALPHKTSMFFAKELLDLGVKVVDLSADYRLELETYEKHYCPHEDKEHIKDSVYGLPEYYKNDLKDAKLVANPGCYPTASLLALLPFVDYIQEDSQIFIDAKSGVSGAGKKLSEVAHFVNLNENHHAYNPFKHRHMPEIEEKVKKVKNKEFQINFVPHLLPITRGMLVSVFATLKEEIDVEKVLEDAYKDSEFVRVRKTPVDLKSTAGTNFCDIFVSRNGKALFINSSIDNLLRGASSQAVVNANIMCGYEEGEGIPKIAYVP
ncbi:N-acetyl-gamma-glutamyl-phosphate reductase [Malaciobacter pacificus]|jgi:N-acetyl-gamma-glutamyl-phosphate reductase|uniref:N-acetyl-gamma-glutamyl-phosphate reductase n=1 Tax=Malaciobacter pacificus TaxID=1080223 RepID=A0A5C2H8P5_9BACT|nr:N-acetyl-gamma-glutamyl-phosphate reductase [Malaciobacter pacificus]QEP33835.1 N-acetyl-gamma-glutamylphosphate reductase, common form [Malaciobacter pacificus]GGD35139.1 N-acetyl-gamma-glutamyl-phosphate reductase [Malaciobacter pacificus]